MILILCVNPVNDLLLAFVCKGRSKIRFEGIIRQGKDKRTGPDPCMKKASPSSGASRLIRKRMPLIQPV